MGNTICSTRKTIIPDIKTLPTLIEVLERDKIKNLEKRILARMINRYTDCPFYDCDEIVVNAVMRNMRSKGFTNIRCDGPNDIYTTSSIVWSELPTYSDKLEK